MSRFSNLKVGEVLSESQYYKVVKKSGDRVQLQTDSGDDIVVNAGYVDNQLSSASQYDKTEKVTKTALAEKFLQSSRVAMTVMFNKQLDPKKVTEEASKIYGELNMGMTEANFTKKLRGVLNLKGEERVMVGRHYGNPDVNGRVQFIDMNVTSGHNQRLVDPRTLNYMIVDGVKYELK